MKQDLEQMFDNAQTMHLLEFINYYTPVNEGQPVQVEGFTDEQIQHNFMLYNRELFQMVRDLKDCIKRLSQDNLSQIERDKEAQWEGEAHELLTRINPNYYKNANE